MAPIKIDAESVRQALEVAFQPLADRIHRSSIAQEVLAEIIRAEAKHGRQTGIPDGTGPDAVFEQLDDLAPNMNAADWALLCKYVTDSSAPATRFDILLEEVAEASEQDDLYALRAELVQVAAMAQAWIFDIDGRLEP